MVIICKENSFRLITKNAVYQIELRAGRVLHGGFVPLGREDVLARQLDENVFLHPGETQLAVAGESFNSVADSRQNESESGKRLEYRGYRISQTDRTEMLVIISEEPRNRLIVEDSYILYQDSGAIRRKTRVINKNTEPVTIEHLSSFNLYHYPLFDLDTTVKDLILHRFRSQWTYEAEHLEHSLGELGLVDGFCRNCWHFENVSSFSSREYIPCFLLEDRKAAVFTVVELETSAPWRFEVGGSASSPKGRFYLSGGMENARYAQWRAVLNPGEALEGAACSLLSVEGSLDEALNALREHQQNALIHRSAADQTFPVIYNEWQNSFGHITEETVFDQLETLQRAGAEIYVIDSGWFCPKCDPNDTNYFGWWSRTGTWIPNRERFPNGIEAVTQAIRGKGMIPGIWCELEAAGSESDCYHESSLLMTRGGKLVTSPDRRFLYFGSPEGRAYAMKVLELMVSYGFGYIKIDYNSDAAPGCDNDGSSPGEGLRRHVEGLYEVLDEFRRRHPDVIIESCSSGGMRLDYGILSRVDICSVTDQEDRRHVGEIYYNASKIIHPSQSGVWSTLHADTSREVMADTLINSMLGRMHISGDVQNFSPEQQKLLRQAIALYKEYRGVLKQARTAYHAKNTLYCDNCGVKLLELTDPDGKLLVAAAIGLRNAKGTHVLASRFAEEGCTYICRVFPDTADAPDRISGEELKRFSFTLERDYQSRLWVFQKIRTEERADEG